MLVLGGAAWLGLTWVLYPASLLLRSRVAVQAGPFDGTIAIVLVARNEPRIAARVAELQALERGASGVEIIIVDDGSHPPIPDFPGATTLRQTASGKAVGLATALAHTSAAVIVFADVRQTIPSDALLPLIAPFADPTIGVVSGVIAKPAKTGAGLYWRYETWLRRQESRTGSTIGATGPWYAIRRSLFVAPPPDLLLDDVWIPMQAAFANARVVVAEDAIVHDVEHAAATEHAKKARTLTGNLQLIQAWPALLDPRANPLWARFIGHKVLRLGTPFAVTSIAIGSLVAAFRPGPFQPVAIALLLAQLALLGAAHFDLGPARTALEVHKASLEAWRRWLRGDFRW